MTHGATRSPDDPTRIVERQPATLSAPQGDDIHAAHVVFGDRLPLAVRYADLLADSGVSHGLVGPREVPRLWSRHLLNCAVVAELVPPGARVVDVGSGAGLPGLVLAIARPDIDVELVEPLLRRTRWLTSAVDELGLSGSVRVHRGRADELAGRLVGDIVTARAVAPLGILASWCMPLVSQGGHVLALKGASAEAEMRRDAAALEALGAVDIELLTCGASIGDPPTAVVRIAVGARRDGSRGGAPGGARERRGRGRRRS